MARSHKPIEDRLLAKFEKNLDTGCWEWFGATAPAGYGQIRINGKVIGAHRVSYEFFRGRIPKGLDLDHLCRVRNCVNPFHLEPVTRQENVYRGDLGGRTHCKKGHVYTVETRFFDNRGKQDCTICRRDRSRPYELKKAGGPHR